MMKYLFFLLTTFTHGDLVDVLKTATTKGKVPAMGAVVFDTEKTIALAVEGTTRSDKKIPPKKEAAWHIGSNGKAMTATLMARLVERGLVKWDTPLGEIFPNNDFHSDARKITITQLLSHTSGLPANPGTVQTAFSKSRTKVAFSALKKKPGTGFTYSNLGYITAGAVIEKLLGTTFEKAIAKELFEPLNIKSFGFGAPTANHTIRGHQNGQPAPTGYDGDNPKIYGPAGGMHLNLSDWVLFAQDQLRGRKGQGKLLKKENYLKLHTPIQDNYALGWGVVMKDGKAVTLNHDGSNTMWYARITLDLVAENGVCVVANAAEDSIPGWITKVTTAGQKLLTK